MPVRFGVIVLTQTCKGLIILYRSRNIQVGHASLLKEKIQQSKTRNYRGQLVGYMGHHRAPYGLLINGERILAYDHQKAVETPAIEIPLRRIVELWKGNGDLFVQGVSQIEAIRAADSELSLGLETSLKALWQRYSRQAFEGLERLVQELTLQKNGQPHSQDGSTWTPENSRIPIVPVTEHTDALTQTLRDLIRNFEDDAGAQFAASESEYEKFTGESNIVPSQSQSLSQQESAIISDLLQLCVSAKPENREWVKTLAQQVAKNEVRLDSIKRIEAIIIELQGITFEAGAKRISAITNRLRELALTRKHHLSRLRKQYAECIQVHTLYTEWKDHSARVVFQSADEARFRREFFAQTLTWL